jgi:hypothetical protein
MMKTIKTEPPSVTIRRNPYHDTLNIRIIAGRIAAGVS